MRMEERYESHVSWRVGCARSELRRQSATWSKMPATPEAALFRCGTPEGREKGNAAELKLRVFKMGRGGTFGLKQGISRIDDLTTGEFASCSGVNLAFSGSGVWFFSASSEGVLISYNLELPQVRLNSSRERKAGFPAGGEALQL